MATRLVLHAVFAVSGVAALLYEITWSRLLALFLGHTVAAVSAVLAAFMGGLAVGAAAGGRIAPGLRRAAALRAYAGLELLVAVCALAVPGTLAAVQPMLAASYDNGQGGAWFAAVRVGCALVSVTLPAAAMGATLPLVVRGGVSGSARAASRDAGTLYAANTLGAALGAALAGFVLLPALGMRLTTVVAAILNVAAAAGAWWISTVPPRADTIPAVPATQAKPATRRQRPSSNPPSSKGATKGATREPRDLGIRWRRVAIAAAILSGAAALVQQVAWTRIAALVIGPTTFAFGAVVMIFIAGLAAGAFAGAWIAGRVASPWPLASALCGAAVLAGAALAGVPRAVTMVADAVAAPGGNFGTLLGFQVTVVTALLLPMTFAFGAVFPLALGLAARRGEAFGRDVAAVYVANTLGALTGALVAGFWMLPALGLQGTVRGAALLVLAASALVVAAAEPRRRRVMAAVAVIAAAGALTWRLASWDAELMSSGAYKYASYLPAELRTPVLRAGTLLFYRDGSEATVTVRRTAGIVALAIDGKVDASNGGDMLTQRLLAHVPLLLHDAPRRVGIIGLGSGVTLASALRHPVERADVIEISPDVVLASAFFARENRDALRDPRVRLVRGDGRTHLALGRDRYDVLIAEPSNPWIAGMAALFTREFFEGASRRLATGGLMCQWAHTYDMSDADLRSIVATFTSVFPATTLWLVGDGDVLLVGSAEPIAAAADAIRRAWSRPGVADDLRDVEVGDPDVLLSLMSAEPPALAKYTAGAELQRDDRLQLEFSGPRGLFGAPAAATAANLKRDLGTPSAGLAWPPRDLAAHAAARGAMFLRAEAHDAAFDEFARGLAADPRSPAAAAGLVRAGAQSGRLDEAERILAGAQRADGHSLDVALALSQLYASRGDFARAAAPLQAEISRDRPEARSLEQLASVAADAADDGALAPLVRRLEQIAPDSTAALFYAATLHALAGRPEAAIQAGEALMRHSLCHARCQNVLGVAYDAAGRRHDARRAFAAAVEADPRDPAGYLNLAAFEMSAGNAAAAARLFAEALVIDPTSAVAQQGLRAARR